MLLTRRQNLALLAGAALAPMTGLRAAAPLAGTAPPRNPFLADSNYPMGHGDSAQSDSTQLPGPTGPTRALTSEEIRYHDLGVFNLGYLTSSPYADGKRVVWTNGSQYMTKFDHESFDVIASLRIPGSAHTDTLTHENFLKTFDSDASFAEKYAAARQSGYPRIFGVYTLLDVDNQYVVCGDGQVELYGDSTPGDRLSSIVMRRMWKKPDTLPGGFIGINMTFDGRIIVATDQGYVIALTRDLQFIAAVRLPNAEAEIPSLPKGVGWIRNSFPVDEKGGIYVASSNDLHKVVWTGAKLSMDPKDGAWSERYSNSLGNGTGATPTLMGFGDDPDKLVVLTDGDKLMNIVAFWRDDVPAGWRQLRGTPSRRIAGMLPCNFGDPALTAAQTEQSVVVTGYGMLIVNNEPRNIPAEILNDWVGKKTVIGYLNHLTQTQPFGTQKFIWDPAARKIRQAWVNREISSPNCVPYVSATSNIVYFIGARNNQFTLEGVDWTSGKSTFHYVIGGARFNNFYSQPIIDTGKRILYGGLYGAVRLQPKG